MARKTFYIIDGHAHIYRAYFAPFRELTSPTGEPTKATFVFVQMLLNLVAMRKPDYLAMVIDSGDETVFRRDIYPAYKSSRKERPSDFSPQETRILQIVKDAGVPIFVVPGFEADDLLATMAHQLCDKGFDTYMVSRDKDLRQVVNDCTFMYDPQKDEVIDAARIEKDHGYTPAQAVEIQTLTGDSTDDIPGIPGVGEKTAARLIAKYTTADAILDHLDELTPKLRENFENNAANLERARKLVTLRKDVEFDFDPESCRFNGLNAPALKTHLEELGFTSLIKRLGDETSTSPTAVANKSAWFNETLFGDSGAAIAREDADLSTSEDCDYRLIDTQESFNAFLKELSQQKRFAFDTETTTLGATAADLVGVSFSWKPGAGYYIPILGPSGSTYLPAGTVLEKLKPLLEDPSIQKVGHNIKYDILALRQRGVAVRGVALDTMIAMFVLDAGRLQYGIDILARELLHFRKIPTTDLIGKGRRQITMDRVELSRMTRYAAEDADIALRLAELLEPRLDAIPVLRDLNDKLETPLIDVLVEMEHNGIAIDPSVLKEQSAILAQRIDALRHQIIDVAGCEFNLDSPRQLADVLFNRLGLKVVKRTKTGPSTDVQVLERLADEHDCPRLILEYRSLVKLKNTYLDNLTDYVNPRTGRIHTSFNQAGASTGRLSSSDPNLQNIPVRTDEGRRIRLAFVPGDPANVLLTADYSQIELRVLAHFTREPALVRAFEADEDIHRAVASEVFGVPLEQVSREQRDQAKIVNFGIIYGVSPYGLARRIEGLSVAAAGDLITAYHKRFPSIASFLQQCVLHAQANGYVQTILGRRRPVLDIGSGVLSVRNAAERIAINSVVQGSAADLIKRAMLNVHHRIGAENRPSRMLLQVHDELVFETPLATVESEAAMVSEEMIAAGKQLGITIPLKVEPGWGNNWQEVK